MQITIGKQTLPISFGFGAIMQYERTTGRAVLDLFADFQSGRAMFTDVVTLLACGLNNGARKAETGNGYSVDEVADLLDESENPTAVITEAMTLLAGSFAQEEGKKKTVALQANRAARRKAS